MRRTSPQDMIGKKFGRWTVVAEDGSTHGESQWKCLCACGTKKSLRLNNLRRCGSCGCLRKEKASGLSKTHGMRHSSTNMSWRDMLRRCRNSTRKDYKYYGDRGISVCKKWESFEGFFEDMGEKPSGMSLERIDNDGPYCKENCRWATSIEQQNNKRNNRVIDYNGKSMTSSQWSSEIGIDHSVLRSRLHRGWSIERALETPVKKIGAA